jgi:predicted O-methyltransferase YrrM
MNIFSEIRSFLKHAADTDNKSAATPSNSTIGGGAIAGGEFSFTKNWFSNVEGIWEALIPRLKPKTILEIGSYEGASACYLVRTLAQESPIEIHCIDTWEGGVEHRNADTDMTSVESRFHHNTTLAINRAAQKVKLVVHKGYSHFHLANLISRNYVNYFDFIYIDGSHQAPDVLTDAVIGFKLLKVGGHMFFDDYLWSEDLPGGIDPLRCPKMAIDAFINCHIRKVQVIAGTPIYQLYIQKTAD